MSKIYRHIIRIALSIIVLGFANCSKQNIPDDMQNFHKNMRRNNDNIENLAHLADSCTPKYKKNYAFFEKKSEIFYQKGLNNIETNEYPQAADDIFKALDAEKTSLELKDATTNDDLHYLGQLYESIGDIYYNVNSVKPASYFYDEALRKFQEASRQHEVIDMLLKIGDLYQNNHISNIALLNYETAEGKRNLTETQLNSILVRKGISLYDISDFKTADSIYESISTKSLQDIEFHYFTACHHYFKNNLRKALPHLIYCFENGSQDMSIKAAEMLADVYFNIGDRDNELAYAQYQAKATSAEARLTPMKMELEAIYDKYIDDNTDKTAGKASRLNKVQWTLLVTTLIILIGVAFAYFVSKRKNKESTQVIQDKERIIDDKEKIINDISKKLEDVSNAVPSRSFDDDFKVFAETRIFKDIKESLEGKVIMTKTVGDYPRLALSKVKIVTMTSKFNECFPNLTHTLSEKHHGLTPHDFRYIILCLMGFSSLEIAVLLQQTYSSTSKRNKHIKDIFGTEEALEHFLPNYIRTIKY